MQDFRPEPPDPDLHVATVGHVRRIVAEDVGFRPAAEALAAALREIADGHERHDPGWWIKRARAALAVYERQAKRAAK
jgi:hypothetical protein